MVILREIDLENLGILLYNLLNRWTQSKVTYQLFKPRFQIWEKYHVRFFRD